MGKSKKRIFNKNNELKGSTLKRSNAISSIIADIKSNKLSEETQKLITLFGITGEELSEAGASFEEISCVKHLIF